MTPPALLPKRIARAFGKATYLLGKRTDGNYVWLEEPTWDCGWYWGFGYLEVYTNNTHPEPARDILEHSHWDSAIIGKREYYDPEKQCFRLSSNHVSHLNEHPDYTATVLTDRESWQLVELMKTCYLLIDAAGVFSQGGSHITSIEQEQLVVKREIWANEINTIILPGLFKQIATLLTPGNDTNPSGE